MEIIGALASAGALAIGTIVGIIIGLVVLSAIIQIWRHFI